MAWTAATLGEICDQVGGIIQTGPFGSQLHQSDYSNDGIPVVMPKDIIEGRIVTDGIARVTSEHVERLSRHKLKPGDIIYGRRGDIGRQALIRHRQAGWLCGTGCLRLNLGDSIIDPIYLHYYLREPDVIEWITNQAIGATLPNLNTSILRSVPIRFPQLPTQRKIAAILSAYDDLIENNLRRIKILEEMAQNLYREWFVKFRFPGHEKIKLVDSPLGKIPEGWEVCPLSQACHLIMGQSPKSEFYNEMGNGLPFHQGVSNFGERFPTDTVYCTVENRIGESGDVLFSVRAPVGRINIANGRIVIGRGLSAIRHKKGYQWFLFHFLKETFNKEDLMGGGTIFKAVTKNDMQGIKFLSPSEQIIKLFEKFVVPMELQIENLTRKNTTLRRTRDLLLPKLISGEVDVSELDITIPEEAA
jgi:type I restriction enzyme S subunit